MTSASSTARLAYPDVPVPVMDSSRVMVAAAFLASYQVGQACERIAIFLRLVRGAIGFAMHLEQVLAVVLHGHDVGRLADGSAEDGVDERLVELALGDPAERAALARLGTLGEFAGDRGEILAAIDAGLDVGHLGGRGS